jgi:hypothetical protein
VGEAKALSREQAAPTIEIAAERRSQPRTPRKTRAILERVGYVAAGAVVSLVISLAVRRAPPPAPAPVIPAAAAMPVAQPLVVPAEKPVDKPVAHAEKPAVRAAVPDELPAPSAAATQFDLQLAGKNAAQAARQCFAPIDHTVSFGVGLLFSREDAMARRVFLSPDEPLSPDQRKCLKEALLYASGGGAPEKSTVAELRFRLRPGDGSKDEIRAFLGK